MKKSKRAHLITGGYPAGSDAGHDMNFARLRLLEFWPSRTVLRSRLPCIFAISGDGCRIQTCW